MLSSLRVPLQNLKQELQVYQKALTKRRAANDALRQAMRERSCADVLSEMSPQRRRSSSAPGGRLRLKGCLDLQCASQHGNSASPPEALDAWARVTLGRLHVGDFSNGGTLCLDSWCQLLSTTEPQLTGAQQRSLWHAMGKKLGDTLSHAEFLNGAASGSPASPRVPRSRASSGTLSPATSFTTVCLSPASQSSLSPRTAREPDSHYDSKRLRATSCQRKKQVLFHRFGRAFERLTDQAREGMIKNHGRREGINLMDFLQACKSLQMNLSRAEAVSLFWRHNKDGLLERDVIEEAMRVSNSEDLLEQSWAISSIQLGARASPTGGLSLASALAALGDDRGAVDAGSLLHLLENHVNINSDQWEAILLALDKEADGKVQLQPLIQWAATIDVGEEADERAVAQFEQSVPPTGRSRLRASLIELSAVCRELDYVPQSPATPTSGSLCSSSSPPSSGSP